MSKTTHSMLSAAISVAALTLMASAHAEDAPKEDAPKEVINMNAYLCKDIARMSGEERAIALAVLHGYYLGKVGATQFQAGDLGRASDEFLEHCLDHPKDPALRTFAKFAK